MQDTYHITEHGKFSFYLYHDTSMHFNDYQSKSTLSQAENELRAANGEVYIFAYIRVRMHLKSKAIIMITI
jgi:hypothetical protein